MLDQFRENARSWIIQTVIAAIALVFIFSFGPGSRGCRSPGAGPTWAAKVNGETVPASTYNQALANKLYFLRLRSGGRQLGAEEMRAANVREDAMKDVVEAELIAQAGEKHGLYVSNEELFKEIQNADQFKKNGQFDEDAYRKYVMNVEGLSPRKYEERLRRSILAQRMLQLTLETVTVSDDELKAEFQKGEEAATVEYVRFLPAQFRDQVQVTDAEVDKTLADKKDEIAKRYEETKFLYVEPHAVKARRLFVPVKADAPAAEETAAKKKLDEAAQALKGGQKWDDLAPQFKGDPAAQSPNGDLGWVSLSRSPLGKSAEEAIFKLKPGQTSDVVRDRFGFALYQALEERQASEKKLEDVQKDIARDMAKDEKAKVLAADAAKKTLEKLKAGESLAAQWPKEETGEQQAMVKPAGATKPQAQTTEEFHPYGGFIPGVGTAPKVSAAAFALSADKRIPDQIVEDAGGYWVFQLKSRTRADMSKFDAQKDTLRERLKGQKQAEMRRTWVEQLKKDASVKENPEMLSYERRRAGYETPSDEG